MDGITPTKFPIAIVVPIIPLAVSLAPLLTIGRQTASAGASSSDAQPAPGYETREVCGWSVRVNRTLLATNGPATDRAIELLSAQLGEIVRHVPPHSLAELRKVPLWISPEYRSQRPGETAR